MYNNKVKTSFARFVLYFKTEFHSRKDYSKLIHCQVNKFTQVYKFHYLPVLLYISAYKLE